MTRKSVPEGVKSKGEDLRNALKASKEALKEANTQYDIRDATVNALTALEAFLCDGDE